MPQYDFYTTWRDRLSDSELSIFRLAQIVYRDLPKAQASEEEHLGAVGLEVEFARDPRSLFERLMTHDAEKVLSELQDLGHSHASKKIRVVPELTVHSYDPVLSFELPASAWGQEEPIISQFARDRSIAKHRLVVASARYREHHRLYISRPLADGSEPSVEWLIHDHADDAFLTAIDNRRWLGPQDARHVMFTEPPSDEEFGTVRDAITQLAVKIQDIEEGNRTPPAGLARYLHEISTRALESLDLIKKYTSSAQPALEFDPTQTRLLLDIGNRSGLPRSTLVLHLWVHTIEAAAFLAADDAYNFGKLERLLEGALLGLQAGGPAWVGTVALPKRVRLDIHFSNDVDIAQLPAALARPPSSALETGTAFDLGVIDRESRIGRALDAVAVDRLVVFAESEMIGPSVPYALFFAELCRELSLRRSVGSAGRVEVLDLFAGSGVASRILSREIPNVHVLSVDLMIRGADLHMDDTPSVTWLNADARSVVGRTGMVDRRYDLAGMDPPHGALLDLVFQSGEHGDSLISDVAKASPWLVMYVGHATQLGRQHLVEVLLKAFYKRIAWFRLGQEVVVVGGPMTHDDVPFDEVTLSVHDRAAVRLRKNGWALEQMLPYRPKPARISGKSLGRGRA